MEGESVMVGEEEPTEAALEDRVAAVKKFAVGELADLKGGWGGWGCVSVTKQTAICRLIRNNEVSHTALGVCGRQSVLRCTRFIPVCELRLSVK